MATDSIKNKSTCLVPHMTFTPASEDPGGCKKTLICLLHLTLPVENYYLIFFDNIWHVFLQDLILNFAVSNNLNIRHCKKQTPAQCTKTKQKNVYSNSLFIKKCLLQFIITLHFYVEWTAKPRQEGLERYLDSKVRPICFGYTKLCLNLL